MTSDTSDLDQRLQFTIDLARRAGDLALSYFRALDTLTIESKGHQDLVSNADREVELFVRAALAEAYPDDGIVGEEHAEVAGRSGFVWVIDPIDGTAGFIKKDGDFSVHIGLAEGGDALAGVVFMPFHNVLYYASKGGGAFAVHGENEPVRLAVSDKTDFGTMNLALTRNHYSEKMAKIIAAFQFASQVRRGSVGLKIGLIAERACDIYIHPSPRTKIWDTCAPQIILEEAGGKLTDLFGSPMRYDIADVQNHNGILATNGVSHENAVEHLRPVLKALGRHQKTDRKKAPGV